MPTKTSNKDLGIATTTTDHLARTLSASDVCKLKQDIKPFDNSVPTTKATEHTSTKTQITDGYVIRLGDAIGPMSDPAHDHIDGGIISQTYRLEARATMGAQGLTAEKKRPARATDVTTQNHGNTMGAITEPTAKGLLDALNARKLARCSLKALKATCGHGRESAEGVLEVLHGDTVTLVATRVNATDPDPTPKCPPPPGSHLMTKFVIVRSGKLPELTETKTGVDTHPLGPKWTGTATPKPNPSAPTVDLKQEKLAEGKTEMVKQGDDRNWSPSNPFGGTYQKKGPDVVAPGEVKPALPALSGDPIPTSSYDATLKNALAAAEKEGRFNRNNSPQFTPQEQRALGDAYKLDQRNKELQQMRDDAQKNAKVLADKEKSARKTTTRTVEKAAERGYLSFDGVKALLSGGDASIIQVAAYGCVGAQTLKVVTYPDQEYVIDLLTIAEILNVFLAVKQTVSIFENFCNLAGKDTFKASFAVKPVMLLKFQFVELTREVQGKPLLKKNRVNKKWELDLAFDPLVEFKATFAMPIARFAGPLGAFVAWLLKKVATAEIGVEILVSFGIAVTGKLNEYEEATIEKPIFTITFSVALFIKFAFGVKREDGAVREHNCGGEIKLSTTIEFPVKFDGWKIEKSGLMFRQQKGDIIWKFEASVIIDVFGWWETEKSVKGEINRWPVQEHWFGPYPGK